MREEFFKALHRRVANTSIVPSTARGMVPRGTVFAARNYLAMIELGTLKKQTEDEFFELLNKETEMLLRELPEGARHWGEARKFLNIFLRGEPLPVVKTENMLI